MSLQTIWGVPKAYNALHPERPSPQPLGYLTAADHERFCHYMARPEHWGGMNGTYRTPSIRRVAMIAEVPTHARHALCLSTPFRAWR